jgi:hypothetical protein
MFTRQDDVTDQRQQIAFLSRLTIDNERTNADLLFEPKDDRRLFDERQYRFHLSVTLCMNIE